MNLIRCPECGHEFSEKKKACPLCCYVLEKPASSPPQPSFAGEKTPGKERKRILKLAQYGILFFILLIWGGFLYSVWVKHSVPPEKGAVLSSQSGPEATEKISEPKSSPAATPTAGAASPTPTAGAASPTPLTTKFRKQKGEVPRESPPGSVQPKMTSPPPATLSTQSSLPSSEPEAQEEKVRPTPEEPPRQYTLNGEKILYSPDISEKRPSVIEEKGQIKEILDKALLYLESRFEIVMRWPLAFEFVAGEEIDKVYGGYLRGLEVGLYRREEEQGRTFHRVYIMKDRAYERIYSTSLHELTHAWQIENCPPDQDDRIIEGFATWIACKGLFDDGDYALYHTYMDHLRDPVYGVGYRYILHLEDEMGEKKAVEFVKKARELPEY